MAAGHGDRLRIYVSWNGATSVARWQLEAGPSRAALAPLRTVARSGFETTIGAPASSRFVAVAALDAHGRVLATSKPVAVSPAARRAVIAIDVSSARAAQRG